jgi:hypothetical protein
VMFNVCCAMCGVSTSPRSETSTACEIILQSRHQRRPSSLQGPSNTWAFITPLDDVVGLRIDDEEW